MKNVTRDIKSNKGPGGLEIEMKLEMRGGPRWRRRDLYWNSWSQQQVRTYFSFRGRRNAIEEL